MRFVCCVSSTLSRANGTPVSPSPIIWDRIKWEIQIGIPSHFGPARMTLSAGAEPKRSQNISHPNENSSFMTEVRLMSVLLNLSSRCPATRRNKTSTHIPRARARWKAHFWEKVDVGRNFNDFINYFGMKFIKKSSSSHSVAREIDLRKGKRARVAESGTIVCTPLRY